MCFIGMVGGLSAFFFFFQAEDGIRDVAVTGVQTCALPIFTQHSYRTAAVASRRMSSAPQNFRRSEEHTSELQSRLHLVCRLLLEKKKKNLNTPWSLHNKNSIQYNTIL